MKNIDRRRFLKATGLSAVPMLIPFSLTAAKVEEQDIQLDKSSKEIVVSFIGDGERLSPTDYLKQLQQIDEKQKIEKDIYGKGGAVKALEEAFALITGKEAAIYLPTGTLANQLAISQLSEDKTKVFVQDTSHIFRDEADASQSVFRKRLMPLAKEETYFTAKELQKAIEELSKQEVFKSGVGAVSIENPVRRKMGASIPVSEIAEISAYCKQNNIGIHLDGARIFLASAWTGISVKEYAQHFDTVYISLYKYLGAAGGAILCGDKFFIDKIPHLIKVHGGTIYQNWMNAAIALEKLNTIEDILAKVVTQAELIAKGLNELQNLEVIAIENGTNIYKLKVASEVQGKQFVENLAKNNQIEVLALNEKNESILMMNETILNYKPSQIIQAFASALT